MSSCETATCPWCKRRAIAIDQRTGRRKVHRVRSDRKGPQCAGSNQHRDSVPEQKLLGATLYGAWHDEVVLQVYSTKASTWVDIEGVGSVKISRADEARR